MHKTNHGAGLKQALRKQRAESKAFMQEQERRLQRMGIRGRIFVYMLLFAVIMLIVLWLMQIVYLNDFYESIKISQIRTAGDELVEVLQKEDDPSELRDEIHTLARQGQICISVYDVKSPAFFVASTEHTYRADVLADCVIHHISNANVAMFYSYAQAQGGLYTERFTRSMNEVTQEGAYHVSEKQTLWQRLTNPQNSGLPDSLVYARIFITEDGDTYFLLLNSSITPVNATVETLRLQMLWISVIMLVLAMIISTVIARHLSQPIYQINRAARQLAKGDFTQDFDVEGYREIDELAETLRYASDEIAKSGTLQQEIVANISHDLRTPLTMIGGYAEFMRDFPEEDHSESVQVIMEETQRLSALVKDVLDDSRLKAGVEQLELTRFDLTAAMAEQVSRYQTLTEKDGYCLRFTAWESVWVYADESKLMQAFGNLLNNAIAHAGTDKTVLVRQLVADGWVRVEVEDHGPGIAEADLANIWQRYYRADAPHRSSRGSGLGLSIVKGVLELHKARYGVESTPGEGSTFWLAMPLPEQQY